MRVLVFVLLTSFILGLSACSSGGDDGSDDYAETATTTDTATITDADTTSVASIEGEVRNEARNYSQSLIENQSVSINLAEVSLPAGSSIEITDLPLYGTVDLSGTQASFTPEKGYIGDDRFKYTLTQSDGTVETYRVTLQISRAQPVSAQIAIDGVAQWKGNATAAYSIVHDDFCAGSFNSSGMVNHWKELSSRGLVAGFGVVVQYCNEDTRYYGEMRRMADAGMEIINHSYSHPVGSDGLLGPTVDWNHELWEAHNELEKRGFHDVSYYVFPLDKSNEYLLREVKAMDYIGARGGQSVRVNNAELNIYDDLAAFKANYDCFNIHQAGQSSCSRSGSSDALVILNSYLDVALETNGGWALRELHDIGTNKGWGWVKVQEYRDHLDYVKLKVDSGDVWMDTPSNVTSYWASRAYCGEPVVKQDGVIEFNNYPDAGNCIKYATPLDVVVTANGGGSIGAIQNDKDIPVQSIGNNKFLLEINPIGDEVFVFHPSN